MTENVIVITTDNTIFIKELEIVDGSMLDGLRKIVCGYIETVRPMNLEAPLMFVCNEEGLIHGLPRNNTGCILYGTYQHGHPIVGNIAIVQQGWSDGEPDIIGLPEETAEKIYDQFVQKYPF